MHIIKYNNIIYKYNDSWHHCIYFLFFWLWFREQHVGQTRDTRLMMDTASFQRTWWSCTRVSSVFTKFCGFFPFPVHGLWCQEGHIKTDTLVDYSLTNAFKSACELQTIHCPSYSGLGFVLITAIIFSLSLKLWSLKITGQGQAFRGPKQQCAWSVLIWLLVPGLTSKPSMMDSQDSKHCMWLFPSFQFKNTNVVLSVLVLHIIHAISH